MAQRAAPRPLASASPRLALRLGPIAAPRAWLLRTTALLPVALASFGAHAQAPTGGQVVAGQAGITQTGTQTTITQGTDRAAINWQGFSVGAGHTVQFQQPSAASWTLNRVVGPDPSVIAGRITANGGVALVNQSGILFSRGAQVDVGSLIATAPGITNENFMAGRMRFDQAARPGAQVRNEGRITVMDRGIAVLAGPRVSNTGEIRARLGRVILAGAEAFTLDLAGDGLISIDITQAVQGGGAGIVTNEGLIEANGGSVLLTASAAGDLVEGLVRNTGTIRANTKAGQPGQVALRATGGGVEVTGRVEATGAAGQRGGTIAVQSDRSVRVAAGAALDASGGSGGGTVLVGTTGVGRNQTMARSTTVERGATIRADATVLGQGGTIAINSTEATLVEGTLSARGGPQGGNGGFVEISGQAVLNINQAPVDVTAPQGETGSILIDPQRIRITNAAAGGSDTVAPAAPVAGGTVSATTAPDTGAVLVRTADIAAVTGNLILEATLGITVEAAITKPTGNLTLNTLAQSNNPSLNGIEIGASVTLTAGSFAANTAGTFTIAASGAALSNGFVSTGGSLSAAGVGASVVIGATGNVTLNGAVSSPTVTINTGGDVTQTGTLSTGALTVVGAGGTGNAASIILGTATNAITGVTSLAATGAVTLHAGAGAVSVGDAASGAALSITAGGTATMTGAISGTGITVTAGAIRQTGGTTNAGAGTGAIAFNASGTIVQSAGASLTGGALTVRGTAGGVTAAGSFTFETGTNTLGSIDARTSGTLLLQASGNGNILGVAGAVSSTTGLVSITGSAGTSLNVTGAVSGAGAVTLTGNSIALGANVTGGSGAVVALQMRSGGLLSGAGVVSAAGASTVRVGAVGAGFDLATGAAGAGGRVTLVAATLNLVNAGTLVLGVNDGGITTAAAVTISTALTTAGSTALDIRGTGAVTVGASVTATGVSIASSGSTLTQNGGTVAAGTGAVVISGNGLVTLGGTGVTGNAITVNSTTGGITLSNAVIVNANAGAGTVNLQAAGAINETGTSRIRAGSLSVTGAGGTGAAASVELLNGQASANEIGTLTLLRATGAAVVYSEQNLSVTDVSAGSGVIASLGTLAVTGNVVVPDISLRSLGVMTLSGNLTATTQLQLSANANITQSGGTIATALLLSGNPTGGLVAGGTLTVNQAGNAITGIGTLRSAGALTVVTGGATVLDGTISGLGASITATGGISQTGGSVNAGSGALVLRSNGTISQGAGATLATTGGLTVGGVTAGDRAGAVTLANSGNAINAITDARATGAMTIHTGAPNLTVTNADATGLLTLTSSGTASFAGTLAGDGVTITADTITQTAGSIAGGTGTVTLRSGGIVLQSGGAITGAALVVSGTAGGTTSSGTITLNQDGNGFGAITSARSTGNIIIASNAAALSVGVIAGDDITIRGTSAGALGTAMTLTGTLTTSGANDTTLRTTGTITQTAGAIISTDTLTIGGLVAGTNAASASLTEANVVNSVSANVTGALAFTTTQAFSTNGNTTNAGSLALTASTITIAAADTLSVSTGDLILAATTSINVAGTLTGVAGQRVVLRSDTIDIAGVITANGLAAIEVGPRTLARSMNIGATVNNTLSLDAGTVAALVAAAPGRLQFGETVIGVSTVRGTDVTIAAAGVVAPPVTTQVVIASEGFIAVNAPLSSASSVELRAAGAITGAGVITTGTGGLTIRGADGSIGSSAGQVNLTATGNQIRRLDARSTAALFVANRGTDIIIRQALGTSVAIDADTRLLTVQSGGLGVTATTGNAGLRATSIAVNSSVTAGSGATATLQIGATGTLTGAGVVSAAGAAGTVEIGASSATTFSIGGVGLPLDVVNNAVAATIRVGRSTFNGGATVTATTTSVDGLITRPGTGTLALIGGDIVLNANISAGSLSLTSTTGGLALGTTTLTATTPDTGRITLDSAAGITQVFGTISAAEFAAIARNGDITLTSGINALGSVVGGVTVGANANGFADTTRGLFASGSIALSVNQPLAVAGGIEARGGTLSLTAARIIQTGRIFANTSANLTATSFGGLALNGALAANTLILSSAGNVTQNASGSIGPSSAGSTALTVQGVFGFGSAANGVVSLTQANDIGSLSAAATGALTIASNNAGGMVVTSATGAGVTLTGASLSLTGAVNAGGDPASLTATAGGITQTSAGLITASSLTVSAAGTVALDAGDAARALPVLWNQVGTLGAVTVTGAGNDFTFHTTPGLTLNGVIGVADAVLIATNGTLGQTAGSITAGSAALAGNGAVTLAGTINTGSGQTTLASATGAITQTGGGITAGNFAAQGTTLDFALGTNAFSGTLALRATAGALSIDQAGSVTLGTINAATVTGSVDIAGLSATGAITVSAGGLTSVSSPISAGGALVLRTNALSLGAGTSVSATSIAVGPRTAGQAIQIGSADTGSTLGFNATTLARLAAAGGQLTIGETLIGTSRVTAGDVTINAALTTTGDVTVLSGGNISLPGAITAGVAILSATGSVIQSDIAASLVTSTGTAVNAGGTIDLRAPGNSINLFAARTTGGDLQVASNSLIQVTTASFVSVPGGGAATIVGATAGGDVFLQAGTITNTSAISAQTGGTLTLRADTMALGAAITATGGTVALETLTLGVSPRPITLGNEVAGTLSLTQGELNQVAASTLAIGRFNGTEASAITVDPLGIAVPGTVGTLRLIGSSLTLGGNLTATGKAVDLRVSGLTSSTGGVIGASSLTLRGLTGGSTAGGAVLVGGTNSIGGLDINSTGAVSLNLDAGGGTIAVAQLRGTSVGVAVTNGGLSVNGASASTSGAFSITGATTLATSATVTAANGLTLSAGTLTIGATATATTGPAALTSTAGALTLNAGVTTLAGGATFASGGSATLVNAPVSVTGGNAGFTGTGFTSTAPGSVTVAGGNLTIANTGAVTIGGALTTTTGSIGVTGATTLNINATIDAANGLTLSAGTLNINTAITLNNGPLGLITTVGDLTIDAAITTLAGGATLSSAGVTRVNAPVSVSGGALAICGGGFTSVASGTLSVLTAHALGVTNTGTVTIGGAVSNALGASSITGATTLVTTATIGGQTGVTLSAGSVTLGAAVSATTGSAAVTATGGTLTANAAVNAVLGNVTLDAAGALVLNGAITSVAGGIITLNAGTALGTAADTITQTAAGILGGAGGGTTNLVVSGRSLDAAVTLNHANRLVTLDATARGALAVTTPGALGVTRASSAGSIAATSSVTLTAESLNLTGAVSAGTLGTVTLNALGGGITQTAAGIITAASLAGGATDAIALSTANNVVFGTGAFTLGDDFALLSTVGLTVGSPLNTPGNAIALTGASLAIQGALTGGTVALAATAGGITQTAAGIITTPSLTATATAGVNLNAGDAAATQTAAWNQVTTLASGSGGTGGFTLRNSRDLSVTGTVTAGTGQLLRLDVTGTPVLQATSTLSAPSGTIAIAASGPIDLRGALTAGLSTLTSATGLVTQTTGAITGGLAVQANGSIDIQNPANAITNFSANAIGGQVEVLATTAMTVSTAVGVALHGGATTTIAGVTGTTVLLTAPDLTLNAAATATTGDVQLRADAMAIAIGAGIIATAGEVRIEQLTLVGAPRGISLGVEIAGSLSLTTAELAAITTPTLIFGRSTGSGASAVAGQITLTGAITVPGSVTNTLRLQGSGIAVNGSLSATGTAVTELRALTESITATTGGVSGQALVATAPFGSVTLSSLNDFATVTGSSSAGGSFTYRDANGFQVVAPGITAATVNLTAETGSITQAAGAPIIATSLFALARTGSALLDGGSAGSTGADLNQITTLLGGGAGAAGVFRLRNATGFTINGVLDNGAGGALGTAQLFAPTGGITQTGGVIHANRLEVALPGGGASFGLANAIGSLGTSTVGGNYTLVNAGSLALAGTVDVGTFAGGPASTTTIILNSGSLTQGSGARLRTDALVVSAPGGDVRLTAGGSNSANDLAQVGTLAGITAGGVADIRLGAPTLVAGQLLAGNAAGTPTGALTLEAPGMTIGSPGQVGTLIRAGTVVLRTQPGFDGPAIPGSGNITQQGGAVEATNLSVSAPSGNILMNRAENRFTTLAAGSSADGSVSGNSLVAGGTIDLTDGGSGFTVQSGIAANGATRLTAGNALTFNVATSVAGPVALSAGGLLTIGGGGALAAGGTVTLFGGSGITVQGSVSGPIVNGATGGVFTLAGGSVAALPDAPGKIDVSAGGLLTSGGNFSAHTIVLSIGGGVDITNTTFNAAELVNVTAGGNMNVSGAVVNANAAQFRTTGFLALDGGTYTLGRVVVFAGFAGISTVAPTVVRNRNAGTFPGIVFDTRQTFGLLDPLAIVQADLAGVAVNDQPTQVRTPNADLPGDFGPSNSNPAGNAQVRLDALQSPVFLLLDGGSFTGVFNTAGRVGVHGRGGSSSATGVLVDPFGRRLEGQSTASLADATRPATGAEISRFRLNDCVISSFNCVAPTQVIVVPVTVPTIPPLVFGIGGRDPDAVSPNVAEEWSTREDEE